MLRPNVIVPHETCFFDAVLQHLLRFGRKGDFSYDEGIRIARQVTLDFHTDLIDAQTRFLQHGDRNTTSIFEHTKQNVFSTEILMMMPLCFFPCENDDPSGSFCKSLEHTSRLLRLR